MGTRLDLVCPLMGGTGARLLLAGLLAVAAVGVPATPVAADATANDNGFLVRASLGYNNLTRAGQWAPLTVDVISLGAAFDGTILVLAQQNLPYRYGASGSSGLSGPTYEFHLSLAANERKRLAAAVLVPATGSFSVELVQGGRTLVTVPATSQAAQSLVAVLSDQPDPIAGALRSLNLGVRPLPSVVTLSNADLPDTEPLLRGFDLIVIDDWSTDLLTASQRRALVDYVAMGGNLLLGSGVAWHRTLSGIDASLLPMQPTGTQIVDMDTTIPGEGSPPATISPGANPSLSPTPSANPLATPRPTPSATPSPAPSLAPPPPMQVEIVTANSVSGSVWLSEHGNPLLIEKSVGAGGVGMSTFDWGAAPIAGWANAAPLLRLAAGRLLLGEPQTPRSSGGQTTWLFGAAAPLPNRTQGDTIAAAVITLPQRDLPSVPLTALFVLIYAVLIFPGNFLLLRAIGRLQLAWVTLPVMALVFISGVYVTGLNSKARLIQRNQITVVYTQPDWTRSLHISYGAVFAPSQGDYHAQVATDGLIAPLDQGTGNGDVHVRPGAGIVDTVNAGAFSMHGFLNESIQPTPGITAVASSAAAAPGSGASPLSVRIHNGSTVTLSGGYVVAGLSAQPVPDLAPGSSADVPIPAPQFLGQFSAQLYSGFPPYGTRPPTPEQLEGNERNTVLSMLLMNNGGLNPLGAGTRAVGPVFIAWSTDPQGPQAVNGTTPVNRNETAYITPIQLSPPPPGPVPAGLIAARLVESSVNASTVVYELAVPIQGDSLRSVSIQYTYPSYSYPPGSGLPIQYWDWTAATWKVGALVYSPTQSGVLSLPATAIEPTSRVVRLRMLSVSRLGASQIYLRGAS
jgi:hypothetical protein